MMGRTPMRNLPPESQKWGRSVEQRLLELEKSAGVTRTNLTAVSKSSGSATRSGANNNVRVEQHEVQIHDVELGLAAHADEMEHIVRPRLDDLDINLTRLEEETLPALEVTLGELDVNLGELDERLDVLRDTDLPALTQRLGTLEDETIPALEDVLTPLPGEIAGMRDRVADVEDVRLPALSDALSGLDTSLSDLEGVVGPLPGAIDAAAAAASAAQGTADTARQEATDKAAAAEAAGVAAAEAQAEAARLAAIAEASSDAADKAAAAEAAAIAAAATDASQKATAAQQAAEAKAATAQSRADAAHDRAEALEGRTSTLETDLAAAESALDTVRDVTLPALNRDLEDLSNTALPALEGRLDGRLNALQRMAAREGALADGMVQPRVALTNGVIRYLTAAPGVTIYVNGDPVEESLPDATIGTVNVTAGDVITSTGPVALYDPSTTSSLPPLSWASRRFFVRTNRNAPHDFRLYSPFNDALVTYVRDGDDSTTEQIVVPAGQVVTFRASASGNHRFNSTERILVAWTSNTSGGNDRDTARPPHRYNFLWRLANRQGVGDAEGAISTALPATGSQTGGMIDWGSGHEGSVYSIGDGAGSDMETGGTPDTISDLYAMPHTLSGYYLVSTEPTTIRVEFWNGEQWALRTKHNLLNASFDNIRAIDVGNQAGSSDGFTQEGADGQEITPSRWRIRGTAPFYMRTNNGLVEYCPVGYNAQTYLPTDDPRVPQLGSRLSGVEYDVQNFSAEWIVAGTVSTDRLDAEDVAAAVGTFLELEAGQITSGTINTNRLNFNEIAGGVASIISLNADRITSGTINTARLNASEIAAAVATVIELNASRITAGTINTARLDAEAVAAAVGTFLELEAGQITSGTISTSLLNAESVAAAVGSFIDINANQITAGTLNTNRLNAASVAAAVGSFLDLNAEVITSGTINTARLNAAEIGAAVGSFIEINASQITAGLVGADRIDVNELTGAVANIIEINASQITSGTFAGEEFTGGTFRGAVFETSEIGSGVRIDPSNGLMAWDVLGRVTVHLGGNTGENLLIADSLRTSHDDEPGLILENATGTGLPGIRFSEDGSASTNHPVIFVDNSWNLRLRGKSNPATGQGAIYLDGGAIIGGGGIGAANGNWMIDNMGGASFNDDVWLRRLYVDQINGWAGSSILISAGTGAGAIFESALGRVSVHSSGSYDVSLLGRSNNHSVRVGWGFGGSAIHGRTSTSSANVFINSNGWLERSTSASRYKINPRQIPDERADRLLGLDPKDWIDKSSADLYADMMNGKESSNEMGSVRRWDHRVPGLIAEDVEAAGLTEFVEYDEEGEIQGLAYDRLWTLLIPVTRKALARIEELEQRLEQLEETACGH